MKLHVLLLCSTALLWSGCVAEMVRDSDERNHYAEYRMQADRLNFDREKAGLPPQPVQSFEDWKAGKAPPQRK